MSDPRAVAEVDLNALRVWVEGLVVYKLIIYSRGVYGPNPSFIIKIAPIFTSVYAFHCYYIRHIAEIIIPSPICYTCLVVA